MKPLCQECLKMTGQKNELDSAGKCPVHGNYFWMQVVWWSLVALLLCTVLALVVYC